MNDKTLTEDQSSSIHELWNSILGSPQKVWVFNEIKNGPVKQSELSRQDADNDWPPASAAVTTIVNDLAKHNLIKKKSAGQTNELSLSPVGVGVGKIFAEVVKAGNIVTRLEPFFSQVSTFDRVNISEILLELEDAEILESSELVLGGPPTEEYTHQIRESKEIKEIARVQTGEDPRNAFLNHLKEGTFVVAEDLWETILDPEESGDPAYLQNLEDNGAEFYVASGDVPSFTLSIFDEDTVLFVIDQCRIVVKSESDIVVKWAENIYEIYKENASKKSAYN